jgi:hypothetical protein
MSILLMPEWPANASLIDPAPVTTPRATSEPARGRRAAPSGGHGPEDGLPAGRQACLPAGRFAALFPVLLTGVPSGDLGRGHWPAFGHSYGVVASRIPRTLKRRAYGRRPLRGLRQHRVDFGGLAVFSPATRAKVNSPAIHCREHRPHLSRSQAPEGGDTPLRHHHPSSTMRPRIHRA